jgi:hypothetical protein
VSDREANIDRRVAAAIRLFLRSMSAITETFDAFGEALHSEDN